tara:strand:- start:18341 stop:18811 length:471 start_codon:yes stop_codon:yes gene_type:complete
MSSEKEVKNEIVLEEAPDVEKKEEPVEQNPVLILLKNVSVLVEMAIKRGTYTATSEEASLVSKTFDEYKEKLESLNGEDATVDIKINTLIDMKVLLDTAVRRGKYQPTELVTVGTIYNSFLELIQKVSEAAQAQNATQEQTEDKPDEESTPEKEGA